MQSNVDLSDGTALPRRTEDRGRSLYFAITAVLFAAFALQLVYHAVRTSVTVDEPVHILAGYRHLQCGDFGINPEHPPLLKLIAAAPLIFRDLADPPWDCGSKLTSKFDSFSYGNSIMAENGVDSIVIPTRIASATVAMLLALLIFLAGLEMFGRWEAATALAILAFEPNIIGHGSVVTTDVAVSTMVFATIFALYRYGKRPSWLRLVTTGIAYGLLLATKHSAVIFVPILLALFIADAFLFQRTPTPFVTRLARRSITFVGVFVMGWAMLWAFYHFRYYAIPAATQDSVSIEAYIKENARPESVGSLPARVTEIVARTHLFPESYVLGMADVIAWGTRNTWIFGQNYSTGQWFYFPLAFAVKSSLALLLLLPLGLALPLFTAGKRRELMFLLAPAIAYFAIAMTSSFTTGVRHIFPIYPLFTVAAAAGAVWCCRKQRFFPFVLVSLLVFNAAVAVKTGPNYLAFANTLWGGYENTYRIFRDSNVETGQSLKLVNEYIQREGIGECWIVAFVHPELLSSIQPCKVMPSNLRIMVSRNPMDPIPPVAEGTFFVTVGDLPSRGGDEYLPIARSEPVAFLGGNVFVYRGSFEIPLVAAMSHAQRSGAFLRINRFDDAVEEGRQAVALGPNDPRTHLALGLALARMGRKEDAKSELRTTIDLAKPDPRFRNNEVRALLEMDRLSRN